jgi:CheY-like chemotaxis protein
MTTTKTLSILTVDDEAGVREIIARCLDDASISLAEAGSEAKRWNGLRRARSCSY